MNPDPTPANTDQTIGLILVCLLLLAIPIAIWLGTRWDDTRQRLAGILNTVQHPPTHEATTQPVCHTHGHTIPPDGFCPICVLDLRADLKAWDRGEL